jgi:hypothetical protein
VGAERSRSDEVQGSTGLARSTTPRQQHGRGEGEGEEV